MYPSRICPQSCQVRQDKQGLRPGNEVLCPGADGLLLIPRPNRPATLSQPPHTSTPNSFFKTTLRIFNVMNPLGQKNLNLCNQNNIYIYISALQKHQHLFTCCYSDHFSDFLLLVDRLLHDYKSFHPRKKKAKVKFSIKIIFLLFLNCSCGISLMNI